MNLSDIKFGFYNGNGSEPMEFKRKYAYGSMGLVKLVQLKIKGEDYIRAGKMNHPSLLKLALDEFNLSYDIQEDSEIPKLKGEEYLLVGLGSLIEVFTGVSFSGESNGYGSDINGIDKENLENVLGKENILKSKYFNKSPSFLVKLKNP